ncbi:hypothetical protein [Absidia glauca]|uniref:Uncharacterized protein n=1 Tax=Absidia glauca TaxID=4829 RepID=A0A163MS88_ABSGL|nr:hypothetical protein [Absidia glauca]
MVSDQTNKNPPTAKSPLLFFLLPHISSITTTTSSSSSTTATTPSSMSVYDNLPTLNSWYCQEQQQLQSSSPLSDCPVVAAVKKRCSHNRNVSFATDPPQIHYLANHSTSLSLTSTSGSNSNSKFPWQPRKGQKRRLTVFSSFHSEIKMEAIYQQTLYEAIIIIP